MSLVLLIDKPQYGPDGMVTLYRGDDWNLAFKVVNRIGSYDQPVDTTTFEGATGFFPSASGGPDLPAESADTGPCGALNVVMPAASTPLVEVSSGGLGPYVVIEDSDGNLKTIPTVDQSLAILDRAFST